MKTKYKIFFAKLIYQFISFFGLYKYRSVTRGSINWELDISEGIDLSIYIFGNFEKKLIKIINKLSEKKKFDIVDIGANVGVHTLQFAKEFNDTRIFAIEPTEFAYKKLQNNVNLNNNLNKNISCFQYFIGAQKLPNEIYSSWNLHNNNNNKKHSLHKGILKKTTGCKSFSLDEFLVKNKVSKDVIIKCDVDGYELDVFTSGKKFLREFKPHIVMELAPYLFEENNYKKDELFNFFIELNYRFFDGDNFEEINDINLFANKIKSGSSKNIFLK